MAGKPGPEKGVSPVHIGIIVVALTAFLGWLAYANLFAPPQAPPVTQEQQKTIEDMDSLAKKSHGDINQLSQDERDRLLKRAGPFAASVLHNIAKTKGY